MSEVRGVLYRCGKRDSKLQTLAGKVNLKVP